MSIFNKIKSLLYETRSTPFYDEADFELKNTWSGATVTEETSLSVTAIFASVKLISTVIAMLPLNIYLKKDGKNVLLNKGTIYDLLTSEPNEFLTPFKFFSLMITYNHLYGAGMAEIERDKKGTPIALWPLITDYVTPVFKNNKLFYKISSNKGASTVLNSGDVLCLPYFGTSVYGWKSPIQIHRETIGLALATAEFGARIFGQGTNPSGFIKSPNKLQPQSLESLKKDLESYAGLGNSHRLMILEHGLEFQRASLPPVDLQYIESRVFTNSEIGRIYGVPLHLLQSNEKTTSWGTGIEELTLGFISYTIQPILTQLEQELKNKLCIDPNMIIKFNLDGILRGKLTERYSAYSAALSSGWLTKEEIRNKEGENTLLDSNGGSEGDKIVEDKE